MVMFLRPSPGQDVAVQTDFTQPAVKQISILPSNKIKKENLEVVENPVPTTVALPLEKPLEISTSLELESHSSPPEVATPEPEKDQMASTKLSIALSPPALPTEVELDPEPELDPETEPSSKADVWTKVKLPWFAGCEYRCKICGILYFYNQATLLTNSPLLNSVLMNAFIDLILLSRSYIQSNSVITNGSASAIFVYYNRVNLCTKITNLALKFVSYNRIKYFR
jgi:hypothetical protein